MLQRTESTGGSFKGRPWLKKGCRAKDDDDDDDDDTNESQEVECNIIKHIIMVCYR